MLFLSGLTCHSSVQVGVVLSFWLLTVQYKWLVYIQSPNIQCTVSWTPQQLWVSTKAQLLEDVNIKCHQNLKFPEEQPPWLIYQKMHVDVRFEQYFHLQCKGFLVLHDSQWSGATTRSTICSRVCGIVLGFGWINLETSSTAIYSPAILRPLEAQWASFSRSYLRSLRQSRKHQKAMAIVFLANHLPGGCAPATSRRDETGKYWAGHLLWQHIFCLDWVCRTWSTCQYSILTVLAGAGIFGALFPLP